MAIRMNQMKVYDKNQEVAKSHKEAVAMSEKNADESKKEGKKEPMMKRVRRKLHEMYGGKNTYMPKKSMETTKTVTPKKLDGIYGKKEAV